MNKDYIEVNRKAYDILASEYKEKYKNNDGANYFYSLLKNVVLKRKKNDKTKMLEIGPGTGTLLNVFENEGIRTIGVELSSNMASIASCTSPNSIIINNNILDVNFLECEFDFILAMAVIHNFPEEDLIKLLDKIKYWLKDDGYFILDTSNNKVTESGYFEKEDYDTRVERYRRKWKKEDLDKFLINQGFYIDELINYVDETSNKEWLVYALKKHIGDES